MNPKISPHIGMVSRDDKTFTQEMRTLESALEYDCNIEIIKRLMEVYTAAIESYESVRDPTFSIYKQKLRNLLQKPEVQNEIKGQLKSPQNPSRPRALTNDPKSKIELTSERITEKALQWHKSETIMTSEKIQENLRKQMDVLNARLHVRKKKSQQNQKITAFEKGVEEIMEEYIQEKHKVQCDIQEKYKDQIDDLNSMPKNDLILQVIKETNKKIGEELADNLRYVEVNKKKKIQNLKSKIKLAI